MGERSQKKPWSTRKQPHAWNEQSLVAAHLLKRDWICSCFVIGGNTRGILSRTVTQGNYVFRATDPPKRFTDLRTLISELFIQTQRSLLKCCDSQLGSFQYPSNQNYQNYPWINTRIVPTTIDRKNASIWEIFRPRSGNFFLWNPIKDTYEDVKN